MFRCDVPARAIARALLESHQKERMAKAQRRKESSPGTGDANTTTMAAAVPPPEGRKRDSTEGSSGNLSSLLMDKSCFGHSVPMDVYTALKYIKCQ